MNVDCTPLQCEFWWSRPSQSGQVFMMGSITDGSQLCLARISSRREIWRFGLCCRRSRGCNNSNCPKAWCARLQKRYGGWLRTRPGSRSDKITAIKCSFNSYCRLPNPKCYKQYCFVPEIILLPFLQHSTRRQHCEQSVLAGLSNGLYKEPNLRGGTSAGALDRFESCTATIAWIA
jgi:hypothetical protein